MKKVIFTILFGISALIFLQSFGIAGLGKIDGTEPGYTGSPGDSLKNCTACHGGTASTIEGWITSNIPSSGYIPGNTYTITAKNTSLGHNRFGFLVSPQKLNGDLIGTLVISDTIKTKLVGNSKYVTYRASSVSSQDFMSWTFNWIAPMGGTGDVVFYGAFNSNQDGHKGGDVTQLSTLRVKENGTNNVSNLSTNLAKVEIYPNPVSSLLNISFDLNKSSSSKIEVVDLSGRKVVTIIDKNTSGFTLKQINTSDFKNGIYIVSIQTENELFTQKICVSH